MGCTVQYVGQKNQSYPNINALIEWLGLTDIAARKAPNVPQLPLSRSPSATFTLSVIPLTRDFSIFSLSDTCCRFSKQQCRLWRTLTDNGESKHVDLNLKILVADMDYQANMHFLGGFYPVAIHVHLTPLNRGGCEAARLEKTGCPQPLV